jgi:molybdenum cofactor biosynthesis enzyme MoaA
MYTYSMVAPLQPETISNEYKELVTFESTNLSPEALALRNKEFLVPLEVTLDKSLRLKVLDQCGMACTFCHNEGTPVSVDNVRRLDGDFVSAGKSDRVSIFLDTNGADFVSGTVRADQTLSDAVDQLTASVPFDEVHLTGGEPTLHPQLADVVGALVEKGNVVKITSNGERFFAMADQLKAAGLNKVVFSIFGTTPAELAAIQGKKFANEKFASLKLNALEKSINAAHSVGISAAANIVMPNLSHAERIMRVIDQFGDKCKIRILNSLDQGTESYEAIYELLAIMGAEPIRVNVTAGASGMSIDYKLPDGKEIGFKQIRRSYLDGVCNDCVLKDNGCDEGYYGVRMYVDKNNAYRVGVCIQRMDLTRPLDQFVTSSLPDMIAKHREEDYYNITNKV